MTHRALFLIAACTLIGACEKGPDRDADAPVPIDRTAKVAERPVMIGFDGPRFAACGRVGRVVDLPRGEDGLLVQSAPAQSATETDRLAEGTRVAMCQRTGGYIGIVYPPDAAPTETDSDVNEDVEEATQTLADLSICGIAKRVTNRQTYEGPCRSGWVDENNIRLVSGRQ